MGALTVRQIETAKATGKRYFLSDGRGLFLRVGPAGGKSWFVRVSINGKQRDKPLGRTWARSTTDAQLSLDPASAIVGRKNFNLDDIEFDGKEHWVRLHVAEWRAAGNRALYLCNQQRFPLVQADRRFHIGNFTFSGYLSSPYFDLAQKEGRVDLAEMQTAVVDAITHAQQTIKDYFRTRAAEQARTVVDEWKDEEVYPFAGEPVTTVEIRSNTCNSVTQPTSRACSRLKIRTRNRR